MVSVLIIAKLVGAQVEYNVNIVNLRKLLSAPKSHVRETSLFTGAIPNQVHNSQNSLFVSVPGQNLGRSSRGEDNVGGGRRVVA